MSTESPVNEGSQTVKSTIVAYHHRGIYCSSLWATRYQLLPAQVRAPIAPPEPGDHGHGHQRHLDPAGPRRPVVFEPQRREDEQEWNIVHQVAVAELHPALAVVEQRRYGDQGDRQPARNFQGVVALDQEGVEERRRREEHAHAKPRRLEEVLSADELGWEKED